MLSVFSISTAIFIKIFAFSQNLQIKKSRWVQGLWAAVAAPRKHRMAIGALPLLILAACGGGANVAATATQGAGPANPQNGTAGGAGGTTGGTPVPPSVTFAQIDASGTTSLTVLRHLSGYAPTSRTAIYDPSASTMAYAPVTPSLTDGLLYVRSIGNGSNGAAFAVIPSATTHTGTALYHGTAAIRVSDAVQQVAYDDATATAVISVDFGAGTQNGIFTMTDATRTDALGQMTSVSGGTVRLDIASNGDATLITGGLGPIVIDGTRSFAKTAFGGPNAAEIAGLAWGRDNDTEINAAFAGQKQ